MRNKVLRAAFVLGNGPSLPVADLPALEGEFTIGVNRIGLSGFVPKVLLWSDAQVPVIHPEILEPTPAIRVTQTPSQWEDHADYLLHHSSPKALDRYDVPIGEEDPSALYQAGAVGAAAVRWAFALGFERVYALGMTGELAGHRVHFHTPPDATRQDRPRPHTLEAYRRERASLAARYGPALLFEDDPAKWPLEDGWSRVQAGHLLRRTIGLCRVRRSS